MDGAAKKQMQQALSAYKQYLFAKSEFLTMGEQRSYDGLAAKNAEVNSLQKSWKVELEYFKQLKHNLPRENARLLKREYSVNKSLLDSQLRKY